MRQKGHVYLDHETWRLKLRRRDEAGVDHWHRVRLGSKSEMPSRAAARRAADRYLERVDPRELHAGTVMQWDAWCDRYIDRWLSMHAAGTRKNQESIINVHLRGAFSGPVHTIGRAAVQDFIVAQHKAGTAPSTLEARFKVLRRMLRQAAADGLAVTPPTLRDFTLPKNEAMGDVIQLKAFSDAECLQIFEEADRRDATAYMLARYVGLRASELLGLTWSLVNLETGAIIVRQQALDGQARPLKTRGSEAVLQAPDELLERLRAYQTEWQAAGHAERGEFLFPAAEGKPETAEVLRDRLHVLLERLSIRRRGLHAFRHRCALSMAAAGVNPEAIRRAMRHSSLRVTAIYLNVSSEDIAAGLARGARGSSFGAMRPQQHPTSQATNVARPEAVDIKGNEVTT